MQGKDWFGAIRAAKQRGAISDSWLAGFFPLWRQEAVNWQTLYRLTTPPRAPGIYIWFSTIDLNGVSQDVPRKVGQTGGGTYNNPRPTKGTINTRLKRYVPGPSGGGKGQTQCELAKQYYGDIAMAVGNTSNQAYSANLDTILEKCKSIFPECFRNKSWNSNGRWYRPKGAMDWALFGGSELQSIYVVWAICEGNDRAGLVGVENDLRAAADAWNQKRGLPRTLPG